jgi:hypothetical protein
MLSGANEPLGFEMAAAFVVAFADGAAPSRLLSQTVLRHHSSVHASCVLKLPCRRPWRQLGGAAH